MVPVACLPTCALVLSECWGLVHTNVRFIPLALLVADTLNTCAVCCLLSVIN